MLDTETYIKLLGCIDSGNLEELKLLLKKEYVETNKDNPDINALINYQKSYNPEVKYGFVYDGKTVLKTHNSIFFLKSRELVTKFELITGQELGEISDGALKRYLDMIKNSIICKSEYSRVISMDECDQISMYSYAQFRIRSVTDTIGQCIQRDSVYLSRDILGEDIRFSLKNGKPELLGESEKGKVLILGIGNTSKQ